MKIGLIAARYAPEFEGGSERVVRALAGALHARGHELRIVAGTDRPRGDDAVLRGEVDGLAVARIPLAEPESFDLELARPRVEALVLDELKGCDLVHVHHWATLSQGLVRRLAPRMPVVVTLHDLFATCPRFFRSSPARLACPPRGEFHTCALCIAPEAPSVEPAELEARLAARAQCFEAEIAAAARWIVPSRSHGERLSSLLALDPARRAVIAPGLTRTLAPPPHVPRLGWGFLRLLHFGNLCAAKGTFDIVEILGRIASHTDPHVIQLTLLGRALEPDFGPTVERLRGHANVRLIGTYDAKALSHEAARADLAVFPSRLEESYGLVVDEAHALGLPAWTSDRGALPERLHTDLGERALPACEPSTWERELKLLARSYDALDTARRGLALHVVPTADDSARLHEALYHEVLGESRV